MTSPEKLHLHCTNHSLLQRPVRPTMVINKPAAVRPPAGQQVAIGPGGNKVMVHQAPPVRPLQQPRPGTPSGAVSQLPMRPTKTASPRPATPMSRPPPAAPLPRPHRPLLAHSLGRPDATVTSSPAPTSSRPEKRKFEPKYVYFSFFPL